MKLTKEEIQFIDTYLKSSDVLYADIRQEMVDHIATGVEQKMEGEALDFYQAFKAYMRVHKKELLKNTKTRWSFSWDAVCQFSIFMVQPYRLLMGIVLFFFFKYIDVNLYFSRDFTINNLFFVLVLSLVLFQVGYFQVYLKKRFYVLEKAGTILTLLYYLQLFFMPFFGKEHVSEYILTVFSLLYLGYLVYFIQVLRSFYRHKYYYL
jgi:hypothetical protein